jgi:hypothetical protein
MRRVNFSLDEAAVDLLNELADRYYGGNKSHTIRAALESLAVHTRHEGWVIGGYVPAVVDRLTACHDCGVPYREGDVLYRPVFQRGDGPKVWPDLPTENWLACSSCAEASAG